LHSWPYTELAALHKPGLHTGIRAGPVLLRDLLFEFHAVGPDFRWSQFEADYQKVLQSVRINAR